MYRLIRRAAALAAGLTLLSAGAALASGTETMTEHGHEALLFSIPTNNPCTGEAGTLTAIASNEVFHVTSHSNGTAHLTGTAEGTATFTPIEGGIPYSGHFASWFGETHSQKNQIEHETGTFVLRAANGSQVVVHMSSHISTNGKGEPTVEFHTQEAHCG